MHARFFVAAHASGNEPVNGLLVRLPNGDSLLPDPFLEAPQILAIVNDQLPPLERPPGMEDDLVAFDGFGEVAAGPVGQRPR